MQTSQLAEFAAGLRYEDLPNDVKESARICIQDTVGVMVFGADLPWSRIVLDYARRNGGDGPCHVLGASGFTTTAPLAALANGAAAHAFEMDSLRKPSTGVHPGGIVPTVLAIGEEADASGRDLILAFIAGMEVMTRIGLATRHSSEEKGFHAPGLTGVFGGAIAAGKLLGLDAGRMRNALGVAGSLCSGLREFAKSHSGGMVKRLHVGRAAEGGVLAASLARDGFEGPGTVLEGGYGFLAAFAEDPLLEKLTDGLGATWETRTICIKRCACHGVAHAPVQALEELRAAHGFMAGDIESATIGTSRKAMASHDIPEPTDVMGAQYSVPFSVALSFFKDPMDPRSFRDVDVADPDILALSRRIKLEHFEETTKPGQAWVCRVGLKLKDGRSFEKTMHDFRGAPTEPMSADELDGKFRASTANLGEAKANALLRGLHDLESQPSLRRLFGGACSG